MRLFAYIDPTLFKQYCRVNWLDESDESRRRYFRDVGTFSISFQNPSEHHILVPDGSCLRLESKEQFTRITNHYTNLYAILHPSTKKEVALVDTVPKHIPGWTSWWSKFLCSWRF